jgi:hypothetical protein
MATGGGGGSYSGDSNLAGAEGEAARIGRTGVDQRMEWTRADADLAGAAEAPPPPPLWVAAPPRPASEKIWTLMGRTSMDDSMSHYLYNGSG